ncbi:AAA family ATPase [Candidatus Bathyarchaeota archaeon]|nr:AAA family ATPase [Candidatus Bathyarchaeota archaeon]
MKFAIVGKGGVGKTTIAGTLARFIARDGYNVIAVDADPAMNLAYAIGVPAEVAKGIVPISENSDLVEDRTGARPGGGAGAIFSLTPKVDDIAEKYGVPGPEGVKLLVMGTVRAGGSGCMCPANALLRALLRHMIFERKDVLILDMEAGIEHLGRGTARGVNAMLNIVEPGTQSVETTFRIKKLAVEIGIDQVFAVGNKISSSEDQRFVEKAMETAGLPIMGYIPFDPAIMRADMFRCAPIDYAPSSSAVEAIKTLKTRLLEKFKGIR